MSGSRFFLDTNAVLYILGGDEALAELLNGQQLYISIITEIELLSYKNITAKEKQAVKNFLEEFVIVNIDSAIRDKTIELKKATSLKLPDSIIAASAMIHNIPFVTSDKQFRTIENFNLLFYEK